MAQMTDTGFIAPYVNYMFAGATATMATNTGPLFLRLMTAMGTSPANKNGNNGTELTGTGYTALGNSMNPTGNAFTTYSASTNAAITNINAVSWSVGSSWSTIVGIEIWNSNATKLRLAQGTLSSSITGATSGDTVQFAATTGISIDPTSW